MAHSSCIDLTAAEKARLLQIARKSIANGLVEGRPLAVAPSACAGALGQRLGCFVTLTQAGALRGCVGLIEGTAPLVESVATIAFKAAFQDSRFPELTTRELDRVLIEISILSAPQVMHIATEAELVASLRPHVDGLILIDGEFRSTFLPKVWKNLPDPIEFVRALKLKAGLTEAHWSDTIRCLRYGTSSVSEHKEPA